MKYLLIFAFFFNIVPVNAQELTNKEIDYMGYVSELALSHCSYSIEEGGYSQGEKARLQSVLGYQNVLVKKIIEEEYPEFLPNFHRDLILSIYTCTEGAKQY